MEPIGCAEMSVNYNRSVLRNIPEELKPFLRPRGSLKGSVRNKFLKLYILVEIRSSRNEERCDRRGMQHACDMRLIYFK